MNARSIGAAALLATLFLAGCGNNQGSGSAGAAGSDSAAQSSATGGPAGGPAGGTGNPSGRRHFSEALMSLNLSDAQKTQIREIMTTARAEAKTQDPETRRATMRAAFKKVQDVLTPDQRVALQAKMAQLRAQQPPAAATP